MTKFKELKDYSLIQDTQNKDPSLWDNAFFLPKHKPHTATLGTMELS